MKILIVVAFVTAVTANAQERPRPFVPRMTTLAGGSLQPSQGLHAAAGLEPSSGERGRGEIIRRPMSEAEWRAIFPKRPGER